MKSSQGIKSSADTTVLIAAGSIVSGLCTLVNTSSFAAKWWIGTDTANFVEFPANTAMSFPLNINNKDIHFGPKTGGDVITAWGFIS